MTMQTIDSDEADADVERLPPQELGQHGAAQLQLLDLVLGLGDVLAKSAADAVRETRKFLLPRFG